MITIVNCQFCQRPCRKVATTVYRCDYHGAIVVQYVLNAFRANLDIDTYNTILVFQYHDATYNATFINDSNNAIKFRVDKVLFKKGRIAGGTTINTLVFTLEFHPEITPDNVQKKMPLYMLMS